MKVLLRTTEYSDDTQGASTSSIDFSSPRPNAGKDEGLRSLHGERRRARGRMLSTAAPEPSSGTGFPELVHPSGIPLTPNPSPALGRGEPILTTTTASEQIARGCRRSQVGERVYGATFAVGGALPLFAALLSLACPFSLWAQGADRVMIPFSDAIRPRLVKVSLLSGGIIVRGYEGKDVLVEAQNKDGKSEAMPKRAQGMKRIKPAGSGLIAEEENNVVTVSTGASEHEVDLLVQVPVNTSLKLNAIDDGDILVENVEGEIEVNNVDGDVKLNKVSGTVVAHTVDGDLTVSLLKVNPGKAMSFSSLDGDIDVTFPADFKASVKVHSNNGEIYSDFDIQPAAATRAPVVKDERAKGGKFSVQVDKGVAGNINGGGLEVLFKAFDGDIYIRRAGK